MSLQIKVYNKSAETVKELSLAPKIFGVEANHELLHQVVVAHQANLRQVLAHTKGKSEVSGGGKKPWKQKGTGRARAGSSRSPIWIGGGVTFGPTKDRNFKKKVNQKMKQKALFMVLSDKLVTDSLVVLDALDFKEYKTKTFQNLLTVVEKNILKNERRDILIINDVKSEKFRYSAQNLAGVKTINLENINLLDLLNHKNLLITENVVKILEKKYA
jgi:large subunit ribosomal protein L4